MKKTGENLREKLLGRLHWLFADERGEVGGPEPEPEPTPEPKPEPEPTSEPEPEPSPEPEPKEPEPEPIDPDAPTPKAQKRIDQLTARAYQAERRADAYAVKVGEMTPEAYKEKHDEYPEGFTPKAEAKAPAFKEDDIWNLYIEGGTYDGKTLAQVHDMGGAAARWALTMFSQEVKGREQAAAAKETEAKTLLEESRKEIDTFAGDLAGELFGKKHDELDDTEKAKVVSTIKETMAWMKEQNKQGYKVLDVRYAYIIKNFDKLQEDAKTKGVTKLLKAVSEQKTKTPSISSNKQGAVKDGYEGYAAMDRNTLARKIEDMPDADYIAFKSKAPDWFKKKYPDLF